jgi:hypothetical protein
MALLFSFANEPKNQLFPDQSLISTFIFQCNQLHARFPLKNEAIHSNKSIMGIVFCLILKQIMGHEKCGGLRMIF